MLVLAGAGGHAKVVYDAWRRGAGAGLAVQVRDDASDNTGRAFLDAGVIVAPALPERWPDEAMLHVAVGTNLARMRLLDSGLALGARLCTIIHPSAVIANSCEVGEGCFIAAGSVLAPCAVLGRGCIVNHGAVVDHDCVIAEGAHLAPGSVLGGAVSVGERCLIGARAVILPGVSIGADATVGAGAVVTRDVSVGVVVRGVPARLD